MEKTLTFRKLCNITPNQDGAIFGDYLFRLGAVGDVRVYDMSKLISPDCHAEDECKLCQFTLDKADLIVPHSNAVSFGPYYFDEDDEFPLLYTNVYNNYAKCDDKKVGVTCVYRITRNGNKFSSALVQIIEIGFTDSNIWRSDNGATDVRPYGNFVVDRSSRLFFAFVMRDGNCDTTYFIFNLPKLSDGTMDETYGVRKVTLTKNDIIRSFIAPYHKFIQGACCHDGLVYSVEGFDKNPSLRIIDMQKGEQIAFYDFLALGIKNETELIDFYGDKCIYADARGNIYEIIF